MESQHADAESDGAVQRSEVSGGAEAATGTASSDDASDRPTSSSSGDSSAASDAIATIDVATAQSAQSSPRGATSDVPSPSDSTPPAVAASLQDDELVAAASPAAADSAPASLPTESDHEIVEAAESMRSDSHSAALSARSSSRSSSPREVRPSSAAVNAAAELPPPSSRPQSALSRRMSAAAAAAAATTAAASSPSTVAAALSTEASPAPASAAPATAVGHTTNRLGMDVALEPLSQVNKAQGSALLHLHLPGAPAAPRTDPDATSNAAGSDAPPPPPPPPTGEERQHRRKLTVAEEKVADDLMQIQLLSALMPRPPQQQQQQQRGPTADPAAASASNSNADGGAGAVAVAGGEVSTFVTAIDLADEAALALVDAAAAAVAAAAADDAEVSDALLSPEIAAEYVAPIEASYEAYAADIDDAEGHGDDHGGGGGGGAPAQGAGESDPASSSFSPSSDADAETDDESRLPTFSEQVHTGVANIARKVALFQADLLALRPRMEGANRRQLYILTREAQLKALAEAKRLAAEVEARAQAALDRRLAREARAAAAAREAKEEERRFALWRAEEEEKGRAAEEAARTEAMLAQARAEKSRRLARLSALDARARAQAQALEAEALRDREEREYVKRKVALFHEQVALELGVDVELDGSDEDLSGLTGTGASPSPAHGAARRRTAMLAAQQGFGLDIPSTSNGCTSRASLAPSRRSVGGSARSRTGSARGEGVGEDGDEPARASAPRGRVRPASKFLSPAAIELRKVLQNSPKVQGAISRLWNLFRKPRGDGLLKNEFVEFHIAFWRCLTRNPPSTPVPPMSAGPAYYQHACVRFATLDWNRRCSVRDELTAAAAAAAAEEEENEGKSPVAMAAAAAIVAAAAAAGGGGGGGAVLGGGLPSLAALHSPVKATGGVAGAHPDAQVRRTNADLLAVKRPDFFAFLFEQVDAAVLTCDPDDFVRVVDAIIAAITDPNVLAAVEGGTYVAAVPKKPAAGAGAAGTGADASAPSTIPAGLFLPLKHVRPLLLSPAPLALAPFQREFTEAGFDFESWRQSTLAERQEAKRAAEAAAEKEAQKARARERAEKKKNAKPGAKLASPTGAGVLPPTSAAAAPSPPLPGSFQGVDSELFLARTIDLSPAELYQREQLLQDSLPAVPPPAAGVVSFASAPPPPQRRPLQSEWYLLRANLPDAPSRKRFLALKWCALSVLLAEYQRLSYKRARLGIGPGGAIVGGIGSIVSAPAAGGEGVEAGLPQAAGAAAAGANVTVSSSDPFLLARLRAQNAQVGGAGGGGAGAAARAQQDQLQSSLDELAHLDRSWTRANRAIDRANLVALRFFPHSKAVRMFGVRPPLETLEVQRTLALEDDAEFDAEAAALAAAGTGGAGGGAGGEGDTASSRRRRLAQLQRRTSLTGPFSLSDHELDGALGADPAGDDGGEYIPSSDSDLSSDFYEGTESEESSTTEDSDEDSDSDDEGSESDSGSGSDGSGGDEKRNKKKKAKAKKNSKGAKSKSNKNASKKKAITAGGEASPSGTSKKAGGKASSKIKGAKTKTHTGGKGKIGKAGTKTDGGGGGGSAKKKRAASPSKAAGGGEKGAAGKKSKKAAKAKKKKEAAAAAAAEAATAEAAAAALAKESSSSSSEEEDQPYQPPSQHSKVYTAAERAAILERERSARLGAAVGSMALLARFAHKKAEEARTSLAARTSASGTAQPRLSPEAERLARAQVDALRARQAEQEEHDPAAEEAELQRLMRELGLRPPTPPLAPDAPPMDGEYPRGTKKSKAAHLSVQELVRQNRARGRRKSVLAALHAAELESDLAATRAHALKLGHTRAAELARRERDEVARRAQRAAELRKVLQGKIGAQDDEWEFNDSDLDSSSDSSSSSGSDSGSGGTAGGDEAKHKAKEGSGVISLKTDLVAVAVASDGDKSAADGAEPTEGAGQVRLQPSSQAELARVLLGAFAANGVELGADAAALMQLVAGPAVAVTAASAATGGKHGRSRSQAARKAAAANTGAGAEGAEGDHSSPSRPSSPPPASASYVYQMTDFERLFASLSTQPNGRAMAVKLMLESRAPGDASREEEILDLLTSPDGGGMSPQAAEALLERVHDSLVRATDARTLGRAGRRHLARLSAQLVSGIVGAHAEEELDLAAVFDGSLPDTPPTGAGAKAKGTTSADLTSDADVPDAAAVESVTGLSMIDAIIALALSKTKQAASRAAKVEAKAGKAEAQSSKIQAARAAKEAKSAAKAARKNARRERKERRERKKLLRAQVQQTADGGASAAAQLSDDSPSEVEADSPSEPDSDSEPESEQDDKESAPAAAPPAGGGGLLTPSQWASIVSSVIDQTGTTGGLALLAHLHKNRVPIAPICDVLHIDPSSVAQFNVEHDVATTRFGRKRAGKMKKVAKKAGKIVKKKEAAAAAAAAAGKGPPASGPKTPAKGKAKGKATPVTAGRKPPRRTRRAGGSAAGGASLDGLGPAEGEEGAELEEGEEGEEVGSEGDAGENEGSDADAGAVEGEQPAPTDGQPQSQRSTGSGSLQALSHASSPAPSSTASVVSSARGSGTSTGTGTGTATGHVSRAGTAGISRPGTGPRGGSRGGGGGGGGETDRDGEARQIALMLLNSGSNMIVAGEQDAAATAANASGRSAGSAAHGTSGRSGASRPRSTKRAPGDLAEHDLSTPQRWDSGGDRSAATSPLQFSPHQRSRSVLLAPSAGTGASRARARSGSKGGATHRSPSRSPPSRGAAGANAAALLNLHLDLGFSAGLGVRGSSLPVSPVRPHSAFATSSRGAFDPDAIEFGVMVLLDSPAQLQQQEEGEGEGGETSRDGTARASVSGFAGARLLSASASASPGGNRTPMLDLALLREDGAAGADSRDQALNQQQQGQQGQEQGQSSHGHSSLSPMQGSMARSRRPSVQRPLSANSSVTSKARAVATVVREQRRVAAAITAEGAISDAQKHASLQGQLARSASRLHPKSAGRARSPHSTTGSPVHRGFGGSGSGNDGSPNGGSPVAREELEVRATRLAQLHRRAAQLAALETHLRAEAAGPRILVSGEDPTGGAGDSGGVRHTSVAFPRRTAWHVRNAAIAAAAAAARNGGVLPSASASASAAGAAGATPGKAAATHYFGSFPLDLFASLPPGAVYDVYSAEGHVGLGMAFEEPEAEPAWHPYRRPEVVAHRRDRAGYYPSKHGADKAVLAARNRVMDSQEALVPRARGIRLRMMVSRIMRSPSASALPVAPGSGLPHATPTPSKHVFVEVNDLWGLTASRRLPPHQRHGEAGEAVVDWSLLIQQREAKRIQQQQEQEQDAASQLQRRLDEAAREMDMVMEKSEEAKEDAEEAQSTFLTATSTEAPRGTPAKSGPESESQALVLSSPSPSPSAAATSLVPATPAPPATLESAIHSLVRKTPAGLLLLQRDRDRWASPAPAGSPLRRDRRSTAAAAASASAMSVSSSQSPMRALQVRSLASSPAPGASPRATAKVDPTVQPFPDWYGADDEEEGGAQEQPAEKVGSGAEEKVSSVATAAAATPRTLGVSQSSPALLLTAASAAAAASSASSPPAAWAQVEWARDALVSQHISRTRAAQRGTGKNTLIPALQSVAPPTREEGATSLRGLPAHVAQAQLRAERIARAEEEARREREERIGAAVAARMASGGSAPAARRATDSSAGALWGSPVQPARPASSSPPGASNGGIGPVPGAESGGWFGETLVTELPIWRSPGVGAGAGAGTRVAAPRSVRKPQQLEPLAPVQPSSSSTAPAPAAEAVSGPAGPAAFLTGVDLDDAEEEGPQDEAGGGAGTGIGADLQPTSSEEKQQHSHPHPTSLSASASAPRLLHSVASPPGQIVTPARVISPSRTRAHQGLCGGSFPAGRVPPARQAASLPSSALFEGRGVAQQHEETKAALRMRLHAATSRHAHGPGAHAAPHPAAAKRPDRMMMAPPSPAVAAAAGHGAGLGGSRGGGSSGSGSGPSLGRSSSTPALLVAAGGSRFLSTAAPSWKTVLAPLHIVRQIPQAQSQQAHDQPQGSGASSPAPSPQRRAAAGGSAGAFTAPTR